MGMMANTPMENHRMGTKLVQTAIFLAFGKQAREEDFRINFGVRFGVRRNARPPMLTVVLFL